MIGIDKLYAVKMNLEVGDNLSFLHDKVRENIKTYAYLLKVIKFFENNKFIKTEKQGRDRVIIFVSKKLKQLSTQELIELLKNG